MCGADAVVIAASNTMPSRAPIARAMRTPRGTSARAKPSVITHSVFVREVMFGSRARDDVTWSQRGEFFFCIAQVSLLLCWDSKRRLRIPRERSVLDSISVAIADADPSGVGARKARRLEEEENDLKSRILRAINKDTITRAHRRQHETPKYIFTRLVVLC